MSATTIPAWKSSGQYGDIRYDTAEGMAKITICRPEVRNAFRPQTLDELSHAFTTARDDASVGVIIFTGQGPDAFCSGGDQRVRGDDGYLDDAGVGRLNVLDLQIQIRRTPKPVVAMVAGYAIGGGHVLHVVCDLTVAADNARFGQTGPRVGSFDAGYGSGLLASIVGQKKAREIWFLCRQYDAAEALEMGLVNTVVPLDRLEEETVAWCRQMLTHSPLALRMIKAGCNAADDGLAGIQQLAGDATLLYYMSAEAQRGPRRLSRETGPRLRPVPPAALEAVGIAGNRWVVGARPRTLPAAVAPVLVGTAVAGGAGPVWAWRAAAALVVALSLQVAVNYANDYQDGVRGTDRDRVGPVRLVATGLASPVAVRRAALVSLAVAGAAGLALAAAVQPWLIAVGAASIVAAWAYTGGPRPYGYAGFGEVFVFVFFGVVAVTGSAYVEEGHLSALAVGASVPVGLLATALLVVNNLRDRSGDATAGQAHPGRPSGRPSHPLPVRRPRRRGPALCAAGWRWRRPRGPCWPWSPPRWRCAPLRRVLAGAVGADLVAVLGQTSRFQLAFAVGLAAGLWVR